MLPPQQRCQKTEKKTGKKVNWAKLKKKRQEIPKKTQLWIVGIFVVCFECQGGGAMGPMDAIGNWGVLRLERQKYLSVKIVDKANDKRERRQNKRAIFPDVSQFDILRDFGPGPEDPFCDLPFAENYKLCAHCAYVIEFESGQAQPLKNTKKEKPHPKRSWGQEAGAHFSQFISFGGVRCEATLLQKILLKIEESCEQQKGSAKKMAA